MGEQLGDAVEAPGEENRAAADIDTPGQPAGAAADVDAPGQPAHAAGDVDAPAQGTRAPDDFQSAFWAAKHALALASAAAFSRHGVHEGQQFILRCLWADDGLTPGEVAKRLGLATSTVTRATARMEASGLLRREPHAGDRRLVRLLLTDRGRALQDVIDQEMDRLTERALSTFGPADRTRVVRALREIQRNLSAS